MSLNLQTMHCLIYPTSAVRATLEVLDCRRGVAVAPSTEAGRNVRLGSRGRVRNCSSLVRSVPQVCGASRNARLYVALPLAQFGSHIV